MKRLIIIACVLALVSLALGDIRQARSHSTTVTSSTTSGAATIYNLTSSIIIDQCTCSVRDTTTLQVFDLSSWGSNDYSIMTQLLRVANQSDKDSLLGGTLDTAYIEYQTCQYNSPNDSAWLSLESVTNYDTLLAVAAGRGTVFPISTTSAIPPGNFVRSRLIFRKQRTATVPDTLTVTWRQIFTPKEY